MTALSPSRIQSPSRSRSIGLAAWLAAPALKYKTVLSVAYGAGLRPSEMVAL
jgi:hypothetical protein